MYVYAVVAVYTLLSSSFCSTSEQLRQPFGVLKRLRRQYVVNALSPGAFGYLQPVQEVPYDFDGKYTIFR